jgi:hypothetical protein
MKRSVSVVVLLSILIAGMGQALAQVDRPSVPPKETEGPDIRCRGAVKHPDGPEIRAAVEPEETGHQVSLPMNRG